MFSLGRFGFVRKLVVALHRMRGAPPAGDVSWRVRPFDMRTVVENMEPDGLHTNVNLDASTVAEIFGDAVLLAGRPQRAIPSSRAA
jgi:hypothetical protein